MAPAVLWQPFLQAWRRLGIYLLLCLCGMAALAGTGGNARARDLAVDLSMRYYHQYLGNASDNYDCGPTSVAMILEAYGKRPGGLSDARWVATVRRATGEPATIGTIYDDLARALTSYGLKYTLIPSSLPGEPDAEIQLMRKAIDAGNLVIPMVHGNVLGRSAAYGDHWVVLAGFTGDSVHILDPDDQPADTSSWVRGGDVTWSTALLAQATLHAQPGPYAMVIYAPGNRPAVQSGQAAVVADTDGDGAYLRSSPAIADNKLTLLPEGMVVTVTGVVPAATADGYDWVAVAVNGQQGYVALKYLSGQ